MPRTRSSQLQYELSEKIISLCRQEDWPAGHQLTERDLASRFAVSRSPVRLALELLASKKVIERSPGARYFLTKSGRELEERPIKLPRAAAENLYMTILRDRFADKLPAQLSEADLLRRYEVPRGVLLKVLLRLSHEGFLRRSPGHGWIFGEVLNSLDVYKASYELRLAIEPAAIRSSNFHPDPAKLDRLYEAHKRLRAGEYKNLTNAKQFDLDAELHETIVSFSGNKFFLDAVEHQNRLRRIAEYESYQTHERIHESHTEHLQILEALRRGDREWAAQLMTRHLLLASESIGAFTGQPKAARRKSATG